MADENKNISSDVREMVKAAGLRCTAARLTVLQHLTRAHGPQTHAEVAAALSDKGFDRATIYRNLTELTEARLVSRVELGDHVWRFEFQRRGKDGEAAAEHPHFVCLTCGEVSCLDDVNVSITPRQPPTTAAGHAAAERRGTPKTAGRGAAAKRVVTDVLLKGQCGNCE